MFKNFLDKAKSAFDDADISKHVATPKNKKPIEFDASFFSFALEGGPLHTEKLTAVGRIKAGEFFSESFFVYPAKVRKQESSFHYFANGSSQLQTVK